MSRVIVIMLALVPFLAASGSAEAETPFAVWLEGVRAEALERGVSPATLDQALAGMAPIARVVELDRKQPESTLTFAQYLERVVSKARERKGRELLSKHKVLLQEIAAKYRVQPHFIVALWGVETDFGRVTGGFPVLTALATLAHDGRRSSFFRKELMLALEIVDQGHISAGAMKGSWAGAMGQSQFMPSSFHSYAVDYDQDGDKDIWGSLPDIFASIANYLARSGWKDDQTWGRIARLPTGFPAAEIGKDAAKSLPEWQALGVRRGDGRDLPGRAITARIVTPEENTMTPAYLVYHNFDVLLKWNRSNYFAIAVGTLANRLRG